MGAKFTICCYYLKHNSEEKNAMRMRTSTASRQTVVSSESSDSGTEEESLFGPQPSRKLWADASGASGSSSRRRSDRQLQAFISTRDQADTATEEWEKLNYDIHSLRYARREVRSRWKKILLHLGYQCEVEALLCVNKQRRFSRDQDQLNKAAQLLKQLLDRTSLFPPETGHQSKYLFVMDRLVLLDSAEDFVRLAKEKYPKQSSLRDSETEKKTDIKAERETC
ncbi:melanoregulin-like [Pseudoliparis swirei]|uniref:melanoregulin-like n=1 Tax=Pseudoliparis swirei TaxID=2059687 RepID=UPI0024BD9E84|nr:melanoregulin-like [Pseudoliparis swirei]